jgi:hypothetical protein
MKYCVKTRDGEILPVFHGQKFQEVPNQFGEVHYLVLTKRDKDQAHLMYKFVGPNHHYTMLCNEHGEPVEVEND